MIRDLRYGLRMLLKKPGFTAIAVLTLALGTGANTVIFSGVYALFLQNLPYTNSDRLVAISQAGKQEFDTGVSYPDFQYWKQRNTVFEQMAVSRYVAMNLSDSYPVERVTGSLISEEMFPLLGARAAVGRTFLAEDFRPASANAVILNHGFWQRRFGADASIIGRAVKLDGKEFTVIGVMPKSFRYPFRASFWLPLSAVEKAELLEDRSATLYEPVALLKPGVTAALAAKEAGSLAEAHERENRSNRSEMLIKVVALGDTLPGVGKYRAPVLVLQFAVLFVLLIACANLANLLLARTTDRRQEFNIRLALGAGRARLVRQVLSESLLLGLIGSVVGLLFAAWGLDALRSIIPSQLQGLVEVEINGPVLLFTLASSLLTSIGFGLIPALIASRQDLNEFLKSGAASATSDPRRRRLSRALVVAEVALTVILLAASGLMIRTFLNLTKEDPGFNPGNAVAVSLSIPQSRYSNAESLAAYYDQAISRIEAVPGVERAGCVGYLPMVGYNPGVEFTIDSAAAAADGAKFKSDFQPVTPGYFQAMGIPLIGGRGFTDSDMKTAPESVVINNTLASRFFSGEDPLGRQINLEGEQAIGSPLVVVGIVGDVKQFGLHTSARPEIYLPMYRHSSTMIVRAAVAEADLIAALREIVPALDSGAAFHIRTVEQVVEDSIEKRRIFALLLGTLASVALVMAALGIYGVISYTVAQRTREIGIRMALGARARDILLGVIKQAFKMALFGIVTGLVALPLVNRALASLLYGVGFIEPVVLAGLVLLVIAVTLLASFIPARRATKVDPSVALRYE